MQKYRVVLVDGYTSSALFYNYLMDIYAEYNPKIDYHVPNDKAHGLEPLMKELTQNKIYDLIVCPDSASNDYEYHKQLKDLGYDILILDHHIASKYSEDAVVINNQLSDNYENKQLSGVGVVYKFFEYCEEKENRNSISRSRQYLDLVALGEISDMMNMNTLENRFICEYGLHHINNKILQALIKEQCYSIFGIKKTAWKDSYYNNSSNKIDQLTIAFYVAPLINALIRMGTIQDKTMLFQAFIEQWDSENYSTEEEFYERVAKNCLNAKSRQKNQKNKATNLLDIQIQNNCLENDKVLILSGDDLDVPTTITGLCAMGMVEKYKRPVMLGRVNGTCHLKGSIRGKDNSDLKDFRQFLLDSGYMDYVEGCINNGL